MSKARRPLLIVGGGVGDETGRRSRELATGDERRGAADVLVWDERDVEHLWAGRPRTLVVRDDPLATWLHARRWTGAGHAATALRIRSHLARRRRSDVVLVGHVALGASPWLARTTGRRLWLPTPDDLDVIEDGLVVPPPSDGGPHTTVVSDLALLAEPMLMDDDRSRWEPGLMVRRRDDRPGARVLAFGPPDRRHGIDLVGRALAARSREIRAAGASVTWLAPVGTGIPEPELADLHRAGVADLIRVVGVKDPSRALEERSPGAAALLLTNRPGATRPDEEALVTAHRHGLRTIGFGTPPAPDLHLDARWTGLPFGDAAEIGDALVRAVRTPGADRPPGPVGLDALIGLVGPG